MRKLWPAILAILAGGIFSVWAMPRLPAQVAIHWGVDGQPNGWAGPLEAALLMPAIAIVIGLVFLAVPRIDPRRESWDLHGSTYWLLVNFVLCFLMTIHVVVLGSALGWPLPVNRLVALGVGLLFLVLGNVMPRIRPNWFVGIRTPWTLSNDRVWRETHRIGGVCLVLAGILIGATGFLGRGFVPAVLIGAVAVCVIIPVAYSWVAWRRLQSTEQGAQQ